MFELLFLVAVVVVNCIMELRMYPPSFDVDGCCCFDFNYRNVAEFDGGGGGCMYRII